MESPDTPGDVWFHQSVIEMPGFRVLTDGQNVEFRYEAGHQDGWNDRAPWVRPSSEDSSPA